MVRAVAGLRQMRTLVLHWLKNDVTLWQHAPQKQLAAGLERDGCRVAALPGEGGVGRTAGRRVWGALPVSLLGSIFHSHKRLQGLFTCRLLAASFSSSLMPIIVVAVLFLITVVNAWIAATATAQSREVSCNQ